MGSLSAPLFMARKQEEDRMINGIHHASFSTKNLDGMVAFYRDLLGFQQISEFGWDDQASDCQTIVGLPGSVVKGVFLRAGRSLIEIFQYILPVGADPNPKRGANDVGITHLCFDVVDVESEYSRLVARGVTFNSKPVRVRDFVIAVYGRDPDENIFELQEILDFSSSFHIYPRGEAQ
jgi:glyoxylase I family protein